MDMLCTSILDQLAQVAVSDTCLGPARHLARSFARLLALILKLMCYIVLLPFVIVYASMGRVLHCCWLDTWSCSEGSIAHTEVL